MRKRSEDAGKIETDVQNRAFQLRAATAAKERKTELRERAGLAGRELP